MYSTLDLFLPHVISNVIIGYDSVICSDCNNDTREYYACTRCSLLRCKYCHTMNTTRNHCKICKSINNESLNYSSCIIHSDKIAEYGYKGIVCYCEQCIYGKKVIVYAQCNKCGYQAEYYDEITFKCYCSDHKTRYSVINYIDLRINIPKEQLTKQCTSCEKKCTVTYLCQCNTQRCLHCFKLETWIILGVVRCNKCNVDCNKILYSLSMFPCTLCSSQAKYVNVVNNTYYCTNHNPNKYVYEISHNKCCKQCLALAFEDEKLCIRHLRDKLKISK